MALGLHGPLGRALGYAGQAVGPIAHGVENIATLGERDNPGSLRAYGADTLHSFDPRHPAGAANLAAILMGRMTPGQAMYLDSINRSTYGPVSNPGFSVKVGAETSPTFLPGRDVNVLAHHVGSPAISGKTMMGGEVGFTATNPFDLLAFMAKGQRARLGQAPERGFPAAYNSRALGGLLPVNPTERLAAIMRIIGQSNIQRRN